MAVTIDGLVSGLDTTGIVTALLELERRPIALFENKQVKNDDKLAAWQEINTKLLSFETAAQKINSASEFQAVSASFQNSDTSKSNNIIDLAVTSNIEPASYNLTVNQLAQGHKVASDQSFSSTTDRISELQTVTIATVTSGTFTFQANTLQGMADEINAANIGRTATIVNTSGSGTPSYRLIVASDGVGADWEFSVLPGGFGSPNVSFSTTSQAQNGLITLDGVEIVRNSNSFNDVISGMAITVRETGSGIITAKNDADAIINNVENFVNSYNELMVDIASKSSYNVSKKEGDVLFGNSTLRNIQEKLRGIVTGRVSGLYEGYDAYSSLAQVGIKSDSSNQLQIDKTVLRAAIESDVDAVTKLFVSSGSGTYTFTQATGATAAGKYETQVISSGGQNVLQVRSSGSNDWITMEGSGSFWNAPKGSIAHGLSLRTSSSNLTVGDTGIMDISVGIAERIAYETGYITEYSRQGAVYNERYHLEKSNSELDDQIVSLENRIAVKQKSLSQKYSQLEVTLSGLKGQGDYLTQQLASLPKSMGR